MTSIPPHSNSSKWSQPLSYSFHAATGVAQQSASQPATVNIYGKVYRGHHYDSVKRENNEHFLLKINEFNLNKVTFP